MLKYVRPWILGLAAMILAGCLAIAQCPAPIPHSPVIHSGFTQLNHTSCGAPYHWAFHSYPIPVHSEPGLPASYALAAEEAVGTWNGLAGHEFLVWEGETELGAEAISVTQASLPSSEEERILGDASTDVDIRTGVIHSAVIRLDDDLSRKIQLTVMMHELGHALGLRHDIRDPRSTMFPLVWDRGIQRITREDVEVITDLLPAGLADAGPVPAEPTPAVSVSEEPAQRCLSRREMLEAFSW